jgi:biotin carboxyl carrier protein
VEQERASVAAADAEAKRAEADFLRYHDVGSLAVSASQVDLAATQARSSAAQVTVALNRQRAMEAQLGLDEADIQTARAEVLRSEAAVRQAELDLSYTRVVAPVAGFVTHRGVQPGDYVQIGQPQLALVPRRVWIIANFKETQLAHMRPGQPVAITVDAYPNLKLNGHVDSIQAGAGARFSLFPPENASGNYVKVVQRVPVKIALDGRGVAGPWPRHVGGPRSPGALSVRNPSILRAMNADSPLPAASAEAPSSINPWWIALAVMLATFMEVLDTSIANVSLSHIAGSLSVSTDESTWVLTTYLISNAIVIPSTAWFGQRIGRKRFLLACVGIFTLSSFLCGVATSLPMLLVMRIVQGAGGGALQPIAQAILLETFPKEKHGQAMGVYGLGVVAAPIIGPVVGGWITDNYSWRWIFFINVPVGIVAMMLMQTSSRIRPGSATPVPGGWTRSGSGSCRFGSAARKCCSTRARKTTGSRLPSSS